MEDLLKLVAQYVSLGLSAIAILVVVIGAIEAVIDILRVMLAGRASDTDKRAVWLKFARWLVAGLTFQLASDIVETTVVPTWDEIGRVAAIGAIRTALTYFLDRDIDTIRDLQARPLHGDDNAKRT